MKKKRLYVMMSTIIIAGMLAGCGSEKATGSGSQTSQAADTIQQTTESGDTAESKASTSDETITETGTAEGDDATEDETLVFENFTGATLFDVEDNWGFAVNSMNMTDEGYVVEYSLWENGTWGYARDFSLVDLAVNGCIIDDWFVNYHFDGQASIPLVTRYGVACGDQEFVIDKEFLAELGITEVTSLTFTFDVYIDSVSFDGFDKKIELYTGSKTDTPYELPQQDNIIMIADNENYTVAAVRAKQRGDYAQFYLYVRANSDKDIRMYMENAVTTSGVEIDCVIGSVNIIDFMSKDEGRIVYFRADPHAPVAEDFTIDFRFVEYASDETPLGTETVAFSGVLTEIDG